MKLKLTLGWLLGLAALTLPLRAQQPAPTNQVPAAVGPAPRPVPLAVAVPVAPARPPAAAPVPPMGARVGAVRPQVVAVPSGPATRLPPLRFEVPEPDRKLEWPISFPGTPVQGVLEYYAR